KPLMESAYGATLGKMLFGVRVIDGNGNRPSLRTAYIRFIPWLLISVCSFLDYVWIYNTRVIAAATDWYSISQASQGNPFSLLVNILAFLAVAECALAALNPLKQAGHDLLAKTYCVRGSRTPPAGT